MKPACGGLGTVSFPHDHPNGYVTTFFEGVIPTMPAVRLQSEPQEAPTVLMVEDEPILLETISECLRDWGYQVVEAPNATEAIAQLVAPQHIDLMFSDIRMPGRMDGFGLARWVRERYPTMRILLTTGYEGQDVGPVDALHDGPILRKPYGLELLRQRLRTLLPEADLAPGSH